MLVAISGSQGSGKAQPLHSKVLCETGWKCIGELTCKDRVITPNGHSAPIIGIFPQGVKDVYIITTHDGGKTEACGDHLWKCSYGQYTKKNNKSFYRLKQEVMTTLSMSAYMQRQKTRKQWGTNLSIPLVTPYLNDNNHQYDIPPYLLGCLLGDGSLTSESVLLTTTDTHILHECSKLLDSGYNFVQQGTSISYRLGHEGKHNNKYIRAFENYDLMKKSPEKFVPNAYKNGPPNDRLKLLQGLMDTDGTVSSNGSSTTFTTTSYALARDVQDIVWSLGGVATISERHPVYKYKDKLHSGLIAYEIALKLPNPSSVFSLPRKKDRCRSSHFEGHKNGSLLLTRRISDITYKGKEEVWCIAIDDPEHLYITDDYIVTHNTTILKRLEAKGYRIIERKTSRSIQSEWGMSLEDIIKDPDLVVKFQNEILARKYKDEHDAERVLHTSSNDRKYQRRTGVVFTERTYADLFAYAVIWLGRENRFDQYLNEYYMKCLRAQQSYDAVYYVKGGKFPIVMDPNRAAVNQHYGRMVDLTMYDFTAQMTQPNRLNIIDVLDADLRAEMIDAQILATYEQREL